MPQHPNHRFGDAWKERFRQAGCQQGYAHTPRIEQDVAIVCAEGRATRNPPPATRWKSERSPIRYASFPDLAGSTSVKRATAMLLLHRPQRAAVALCVALSGCVSVDPRSDVRQVDQRVVAATGVGPVERPEDAAALAARIAERLADGLTSEEALEICLLNNPRIRAAYQRVGVARAEVVQAGLLRNPSLSLALRFPDGGGLSNLDVAIAQQIADLWLIPARRRAAERELDRESLAVAREVSAAALDARAAYFDALAMDREREIAAENRSVAQQLVDLTLARLAAGVGSEIDVNLARAELMQTDLSVRTATFASFDARRRLATLLGLHLSPDELVLAESLPTPPAWEPVERLLVAESARCRLDLVAADCLVDATAARVELETRGVFADVELGVGFERMERGRRGDRTWLADTAWASAEAGEPSLPSLRPRDKLPTDTILGPMLSLELPIFDQNQARIAQARMLHEAALADREARLLDVTHETRAAARRARTAWDIANYYRDDFLPLLERNLELARDAYRSGNLSLTAVLEAQKPLLAARSRYAEALRDGAVALVELEKAVGAPFAKLTALSAPVAAPPAAQ